ncbi:MAG: divalent metal cation transporter [Candidatus Roizmanbacteria bacterium]|nr:MAG: divalent metal cation transporter [Candidatus Roizmanbacteria bacterium]
MNFFYHFKRRFLILIAVVGPGLITAFADNDAGGVATYSVAASKFGYSMLTTLIPITIVLMITQEIGARIAVVTGKGLGDLIREKYGIRIALFMFLLLFIVNFGVILQNLGGLKSALTLFQLDYRIFLPLLVGFLFLFIIRSSFTKIERFFLFLILFYLAYFFSALLSKPDWALTGRSLLRPPDGISFDYLYTSVAVLGTTVTAWGQFFINSYIKDKKITPEKLKYQRLEIYAGAFLTDLFSLFMMVAVIATIFVNGIQITGAADAALAIKPVAGALASTFFGVGLLIAGFLGLAIVPLATAYAFSEFFGYEGSLDTSLDKSKFFYGFFLLQIILGTIFIWFPNISLFNITLYADFLNGLMLPVIFFFLYKLANSEELMGSYKNNKVQNILLIVSGVAITIAALLGGFGKLLGF